MFLVNLGSFWLLPFLLSLSFLLSFWLASVSFWCFLLCRGLFFPLNFCQPLHARQWETKMKWKNPRPVFLKNNFVQLHKIYLQKQGPTNTEMHEKRTEATQKHNRKDRQTTKERIQNDPKLFRSIKNGPILPRPG